MPVGLGTPIPNCSTDRGVVRQTLWEGFRGNLRFVFSPLDLLS